MIVIELDQFVFDDTWHMSSIRLGLIGMGNIGRHHAGYLLAGKVVRCRLTAVCSTSPNKLESFKPMEIWEDGLKLIRSGTVDAVLVATPHYQHCDLGIAALEAGVHLMVEKPISAHIADGLRLIDAHQRNAGVVFGAMFQLRMEPRYQILRRLIRSGELGRLVRVNWINTDWYRTEAYYSSGGWRATWGGEGGGVLLNQCLHNLDILFWLFGLPSSIRAHVTLGRDHSIEVEDNVTAWLGYADGSSGVFVASTGEAPGTNRLEITGTQGRVVLEEGRIRFIRNEDDMADFSKRSTSGFTKPAVWNVDIPFIDAEDPHAQLMRNFTEAILDGVPLIAPGEEGLGSLQLANSMMMSGLTETTVNLPLNAGAYETLLAELVRTSKQEKKTVVSATTNFAQSFRR